MPVYLFQHPKTEEIIEITQKMNDPHIYSDEEGVRWNRVFTKPNAAISDNLINADTSEADFVRKTSEKNYTLGDMWNLSAELSEKRKRVNGQDPIKEKAKKSYERKTGKKHPHSKQGGGGDIAI
jgi:hypothetical protein